MKASLYERYGGPEVLSLGETPSPKPKDREILIKVMAATVNRSDCAMLTGKPAIMRASVGLTKPKNPILGTDLAGQIVAVGSEVSRFKVGDRVFGFDDGGLSSHAQYTVISEKNALGIVPENIDYKEAAASIEGSHYALNFLNKVEVNAGDEILINGASGAIGSALLQWCKILGAKVTAVTETDYVDAIAALGADVVIDYTQEDFTQLEQAFPFVFDAVGKSTFGACKPLLTSKGVYISSELGPRSENLWKSMLGRFSSGKRVAFPLPLNRQQSVDQVAEALKKRRLRPLIDRTYGLDQTPEAFNYVLKGQKLGNVVLEINA